MKKVLICIILATAAVISQEVSAQYFTQTHSRGFIHRAYVKYCNSTTITVTSGYGECNGEYWEVSNDTTHYMTSLTTSEDFHYIYIDDSVSVYPAVTIIDSTAEPSWNDSKQGWYNGNDRCIGVVWSTSGSATVFPFGTDGDGRYFATGECMKYLLENGNPDGTFQVLEATNYSPVNSTALLISGRNFDANGYVSLFVTPYEETYAELCDAAYYGSANFQGWIPIQIGWSRDLRWVGNDDDDNLVRIQIWGYRIER